MGLRRAAVDQLEDGKETNVKIKWFWVISSNTTDLAKVKKIHKNVKVCFFNICQVGVTNI